MLSEMSLHTFDYISDSKKERDILSVSCGASFETPIKRIICFHHKMKSTIRLLVVHASVHIRWKP